MFWTGHQRDTSSVLTEQKKNTPQRTGSLLQMRDHARQLQNLLSNGHFDSLAFGDVLDQSWNLKRQLASTISNSEIDSWYRLAREAGALGGKVCGAGGGGFLLFVAPPESQERVRQAMAGLREISIEPEVHGSQILFAE
jgi:D-glycero-alpha-D-manno-heptose-7-phosphate kinase